MGVLYYESSHHLQARINLDWKDGCETIVTESILYSLCEQNKQKIDPQSGNIVVKVQDDKTHSQQHCVFSNILYRLEKIKRNQAKLRQLGL